MKILEQRTHFPSHVVRRAAYDRLVPSGSDSGYLHWLQMRKNEFHRMHPGVKGDKFHRLFDRHLENMK